MQALLSRITSIFSRGTIDEFHIWCFWRLYWARKGYGPAHGTNFLNLGRLFFLKRPEGSWRHGRFTDDDIIFGPLTIAKTNWKHLSLILRSANKDEEDAHCSLTGYIYNWGFRLFLPNFIKPVMEKTKASWDEATIKRMGRDWYPTYHTREFGFSCNEGHFSLYYGQQNANGWGGDMINRRWSCFLPWTQWRFVRHTLYDTVGDVFYEYQHQKNTSVTNDLSSEKKRECPSAYFLIRDYDGKKIVAKTVIEEREWYKGEKWCSWLSFFYKPMVRTSLDISFAEEVGTGKGSWKGGLCGTSIDLENHKETHQQAFARYCLKEYNHKEGRYKIEFIRRVDPDELILLVPAKNSW